MIDPVNDMLNRIKNAQAVFHQTVEVPFSNLKYQIAKILEKESFIGEAEKKGKTTQKIIKINLKYGKAGAGEKMVPAILNVRKISKPGQRIYVKHQDLKSVRGGYGISIISTSKGLMTNKEAKKQKLGGEVLCEIW